ncbi:TonB-linked outer membrane protein, SusC/RagA family [Draconibacterium orientale]|jgi:TonB-linked SusC/RagA family outer membrane protein|uniref:Membrane protein n=1 Tax=Draconibacterium orientale TaxID=1168034 RepID=X5DUV4_9BACT|nr:TonB-dependent receptor [Draconibacterium orientale]AHW58960.1 membrane protein [Draconibacterium orientale]SET52063.1 TonB-linked outer membrane protein, SusC/RagA family [Draconibacterium orientale]
MKKKAKPCYPGTGWHKLFRIMKLSVILLFVGMMQVTASVYSQTTKLSVDAHNQKIVDVLTTIEEQSEFRFFYKNEQVDVNRKVNVNMEDKLVEEVLDNIFAGTDVTYKFFEDKLILLSKEGEIEKDEEILSQQQKTVSGSVKDETGEPLPGVTVIIKGTTQGTVTDMDGSYNLPNIPENATLIFSFVGMTTQEIFVGNQSTVNVTLKVDAIGIEEVVAIGYGTVKKSDVTGSVISVDSEDMMKRNPVNIGQGLQGVAAGVSVIRNSGDPSGDATIRIRGVATVNNSADPLFVVDGMQVGSSIEFLNPNDVKSIEVLKDASATAIYGARGANGVILITTKKGSNGPTNIKLTANFGVQTLANKLDMMNAEQFVKAARQAAANDGNILTNDAWINYDKELNSIDWQDEMTQVALQQNYNVNVSGGSESTQALMSVGYLNNDGIIINSNFKRITARANIDHKIKDFIRTGINLSFMRNERYGGGNLQNYAAIIPTMDDVDENGNLLNVPVQYPDGTWGHFKREGNGDTNKGQDNPVAQAETRDSKNYSNRLVTNAYLEFDIAEGLVFKTIGGLNYSGGSYHGYNMKHDRTYLSIDRPDEFNISQYQNISYSVESYLTYDIKIDNKHRLNLMAGHSVSKYVPQDINASALDFPAETIRRIELTNNTSSINAGGGLGRESRGQSFFGRVNYSLLDRYLFTATVRKDGSSNFGAGNRYGTFPSASLAWRLTEENFMKDSDLFSNIKLRLGWGQTGNAGNSTNLSVDQLSSNRIAYYHFVDGSESIAPGLAQVREIDTNLKWETNEQTNIGLDLGFLDNGLNFSFDYFIRDAKDLLLNRPLRPSTGYIDIYTNAGHIRNSGFEFMASYQKQMGDWDINIRLNGATLKNEAIDVGNDIYFNEDVADGDYWDRYSLTRNGYPVGSFYGWRVDGIFQNQSEIDALNANVDPENNSGYYQSASTQPGDYKYKDLNDDGWIDDQDREIIGDGYPTLNFGLNLILAYKNWDLNLSAYGVLGQEILSYAYKNQTSMYIAAGGYRNVLVDYAQNAWSENNKNNEYPRLTKQDANHNGQVSDAFIKNGDFLKVQNLQVGYTFPKSNIQGLKMENLRLFASIENLFTITGYDAGDPEIGTSKVLQTGFDGGRYPFPRTYVFGLSLGF